jgi:hypothetical protein
VKELLARVQDAPAKQRLEYEAQEIRMRLAKIRRGLLY